VVNRALVVIAVDLSVLGDGEEELELRGELLFRVQAVGEVYSASEKGRIRYILKVKEGQIVWAKEG
jgi:hypothetical protein